MSKDAKIGFAGASVLLAVLVVYLLVVPRHHRVTHPAVAVVTPPGGTAPSEPSSPAATPVSTSGSTLAEAPPTTAPAMAEKPIESVTPLVTPVVSTETPAAPAGSLAEASTPPSAAPAAAPANATGNGSWDSLFHPQSTAPGLMASDNVPSIAHTAPVSPGSVVNSSTTGADAMNDDTPARPTASSSHHSRHSSNASNASSASDTESAAASDSAGRPYKVKAGETLSSIAADVYGNSRFYIAIMHANPTINPNRLKVGTKLTLPAAADVKPIVSRSSDSSTETSDTATAYESGGPAGGGIILAAAASPQTDTIVNADPAGFYTIKKGDTLYGISKKLYGNLHEATVIYSLNKTVIGPDQAKLKVGTVLQLPTTGAVEAAANAAQ